MFVVYGEESAQVPGLGHVSVLLTFASPFPVLSLTFRQSLEGKINVKRS